MRREAKLRWRSRARSGLLSVLAMCALTWPAATVAAARADHPGRHRFPGLPRFFSPRSPWNSPIAPSARLDPGSAQMIARVVAEVNREEAGRHGPWINTHAWSTPVYTVGKHARRKRVILDHAPDRALSRAFARVPLPATARPADGGDRHLVVYQPSTDRMWEFFHLLRRGRHWHAGWGGAMRHVSKNRGVYGPRAWPGAKPWWGATATSLPLVGGLMRVNELEAGHIDHALAIALPETRAGVWAWPARRGDGNTPGADVIPEGAKLRLDPKLDLSRLDMPPFTRMMAEAAQRYGIIVRDRAGVIAFAAQDPTPLPGVDPYTNDPFTTRPLPGGLFDGKWPLDLLAKFPWSQLQVLKLSLHHR